MMMLGGATPAGAARPHLTAILVGARSRSRRARGGRRTESTVPRRAASDAYARHATQNPDSERRHRDRGSWGGGLSVFVVTGTVWSLGRDVCYVGWSTVSCRLPTGRSNKRLPFFVACSVVQCSAVQCSAVQGVRCRRTAYSYVYIRYQYNINNATADEKGRVHTVQNALSWAFFVVRGVGALPAF